MANLPEGMITFLFTDIEGSTRRWQQHRGVMRTAVDRHFELLQQAIGNHRGVDFKHVGDAVQAAFKSPRDAVAATLDAQRAILAEPWPEELGPLRVRMGLHTGEATPEGEDYPPTPCLNRLSRMLSAGHGEQILLSQATWQIIHTELPTGSSLRDLGIHRLRDFEEEEERIFQLEAPGLPTEFPRLKTLPPDWPVSSVRIVGRDKDVGRIRTHLGERRLVTLIGPPGVGKTRLAIEVARGMVEDFADGVYFVDLSSLVDPDLVAQTIAKSVGAVETGGRTPEEGVLDHLRVRSVLLVLDNFEQVISAAEMVSRLLVACPGVKVVVTSREPLKQRQVEQQYPVQPLAVPAGENEEWAEQMRDVPSVQLFEIEASRIKPLFQIQSEDGPAVAEICRLLQGLPLAIELAADWVDTLPPEQILTRLKSTQHMREEHPSSLSILRDPSSDRPWRQQTMEAAVEWSYDLLREHRATDSPHPNRSNRRSSRVTLEMDLQAAFRRVSVFRGPFSLAAAEEVCAGDPSLHRKETVLEAIRALVGKSLLQEVGQGRDARYTMLVVIRAYGQELLRESTAKRQREAADAWDRHAHWYQRLAKQAPQVQGRREEELYRQLEAEYDNLRLLLERETEKKNGPSVLELSVDLGGFWTRYGYFTEGRRWLDLGLRIASKVSLRLRAEALNLTGNLAMAQGDYDRADSALSQYLDLSRSLGSRPGIAAALGNLGNVAFDRGDLDRAEELHGQSLELCRELGNRSGIAGTLRSLGNAALERGDLDRAEELHEQSLALEQEMGSRDGIAASLDSLGSVAFDRGDLDRAEAYYERSLALEQELGNKAGTAASIGNLGTVALARGDLDRAEELHGQSVAMDRQMGNRGGMATSLENLGSVAFDRGDLDRAEAYYEQSLALERELGNRRAEVSTTMFLGLVAFERGDYDRAREQFTDAHNLSRNLAKTVSEATILSNLGLALHALGDNTGATWRYRGALTLFHERDNSPGVAWCLTGLAATAWGEGNLLRAARIAGAAESTREAKGRPIGMAQQRRIDALMAPLLEQRERPVVAAAWEEGRSLSREEIVAEISGTAAEEEEVSVPLRPDSV